MDGVFGEINMNLGDRMKHYERTVGGQLTLRCPAIVRVDGRAFHTLTRGLEEPFDKGFRAAMVRMATHLCEVIPTACFAYGQSDEVSLLLIDYMRFGTCQFFDGKVQKLVSVIASEATAIFNQVVREIAPASPLGKFESTRATFDARVFSVPERDVENYFIWRQRDAIRNSILAVGQSHFSVAELHGRSTDEILGMLESKAETENDRSIIYESHPEEFQHGFVITRLETEEEERRRWVYMPAPSFSDSRDLIEQLLEPEEE